MPDLPRLQRLASAALRHIRDAEFLASGTPPISLDQASHLLGFGPECARKACLHEAWADTAIGHAIGARGEEVVDFVAALDARAARYRVGAWRARFPELVGWSESCRYDATGTADTQPEIVVRRLGAARHAVDDVILSLWADGLLNERALRA